MTNHSYKHHFKETLQLAYPVSLAHLGHVLLGVVDSMMVGRVGADSLAAAALVNGITFLFLVFGIGLSLVITPLVAIARGKNRFNECGAILNNALWLNTGFTILLAVVIFYSAPLMHLLNQPPQVVRLAIPYARIIGFSFVPFIYFQSEKQFLEGLGITKPAMYAMIGANLINAFGNWVFIYGNLGMPALGLKGAGYATLFTRFFLAFALIVYLRSGNRFDLFQISFSFRGLQLKLIKRLAGLGFPTGLQHFFEIGAFSFSAIMIGWLGSKQLAAHQIALSMASMSFMITLGITSAGTIRVGQYLGKNNLNELRRAGFSTIFLAMASMTVFGAIFVLFRNRLPLLFIADRQVIQITAQLLIIAALFQISDGTQAAGVAILRGLTDVKIPMLLSFLAYWLMGLPVGYFLGFYFKMDVYGIWLGLLSGLTFAAVSFVLRFLFKTRRPLQSE